MRVKVLLMEKNILKLSELSKFFNIAHTSKIAGVFVENKVINVLFPWNLFCHKRTSPHVENILLCK
jgi:hypothetical protein